MKSGEGGTGFKIMHGRGAGGGEAGHCKNTDGEGGMERCYLGEGAYL